MPVRIGSRFRIDGVECVVVPVSPTTEMKLEGAKALLPESVDFSHHCWNVMVDALNASEIEDTDNPAMKRDT